MRSDQMVARRSRSEVIDNVPPDIVGQVTQDFRDAGAAEVKVEPNPNGTWRIIATFRD